MLKEDDRIEVDMLGFKENIKGTVTKTVKISGKIYVYYKPDKQAYVGAPPESSAHIGRCTEIETTNKKIK